MDYATGGPYRFPSTGGVASPATQVGRPLQGSPTGIAFSLDFKHLYVARHAGHMTLYGASAASHVAVIDRGGTVSFINAGPAAAELDGIAVAASRVPGQPPFIFVNQNDGLISKVDLTTATPVTSNVMSGESRGDFVTVGPDGCLYATQTDRVLRSRTPTVPAGWRRPTPPSRPRVRPSARSTGDGERGARSAIRRGGPPSQRPEGGGPNRARARRRVRSCGGAHCRPAPLTGSTVTTPCFRRTSITVV